MALESHAERNPTCRMTESADEKRTTLRKEQHRLVRERAELKAEVARMEASRDADALRALDARLHRRAEALHAFRDALEAFHQRFGPLGSQ
jgi:chromosome segregation ATPase